MWKVKRGKIKKLVLSKYYANEDLKTVTLRLGFKTLRFIWLKRLLSEHDILFCMLVNSLSKPYGRIN